MTQGRVFASLDPFYESGPMLGRIQANQAFMDALLALDPFDSYRFYLPSQAARRDLAAILEERWPGIWGRAGFELLGRERLPAELAAAQHHVFHLSDCIVHPANLAALRNAFSRHIFPITATTHSLSYARYAQDFLKHLSPCVTPRDAVVATSRSAVAAVRGFYDTLRQGYGLDRQAFPEPAVELIPLGVDLKTYQPPDELGRQRMRAGLGFGPETVFLVLARLCHSSKMDFIPILRAFQRLFAESRPPGGVRLVLAGWSEEDWGRSVIEDLARNLGLPLTVAERPSEEEKRRLLAASDVFLSPSDNLQETFGLTLLEAQAMGLPVIASDFDGYRDLVLPERTGILIPTLGPTLTRRVDLLASMSFDNHTHLALAQRLAVDVPALALALGRLAGSHAERKALAREALIHARAFSWEGVVRAHLDLWEDLWLRPAPERPPGGHPGLLSYGRVFAGYPTLGLAAGMVFRASRTGQAVYRGQDHPVVHAGLLGGIDLAAVRALLVLARKPRQASTLLAGLCAVHPELDDEAAQAHLLWCLKHDLLESAPEA